MLQTTVRSILTLGAQSTGGDSYDIGVGAAIMKNVIGCKSDVIEIFLDRGTYL